MQLKKARIKRSEIGKVWRQECFYVRYRPPARDVTYHWSPADRSMSRTPLAHGRRLKTTNTGEDQSNKKNGKKQLQLVSILLLIVQQYVHSSTYTAVRTQPRTVKTQAFFCSTTSKVSTPPAGNKGNVQAFTSRSKNGDYISARLQESKGKYSLALLVPFLTHAEAREQLRTAPVRWDVLPVQLLAIQKKRRKHVRVRSALR